MEDSTILILPSNLKENLVKPVCPVQESGGKGSLLNAQHALDPRARQLPYLGTQLRRWEAREGGPLGSALVSKG